MQNKSRRHTVTLAEISWLKHPAHQTVSPYEQEFFASFFQKRRVFPFLKKPRHWPTQANASKRHGCAARQGVDKPVFSTANKSRARLALSVCLSASIAGCGTVGAIKRSVVGGSDPNTPKVLAGFIGGVVADEPRAAVAARQVLALGGNAADAAVTLGFMLAVTLPSRASLGGGGACVVYSPAAKPNGGVPEAVMFLPAAPTLRAGDRPAATPMLARGLYLLSARYGNRNFAEMIAPAEEAARSGFPISRALAQDLSLVAGPLVQDQQAQSVFAPRGAPLSDGDTLVQPNLAASLLQLRNAGVGDLYQGLLAHRMVEASAQAGGPISLEDLRTSKASLSPVIDRGAGADHVAFVPLPADGGLAAAAAFGVLQHDPSAYQVAGDTSQSVAARFRAQGGEANALLSQPGAAASLPSLPASTGFVVVDRHGEAVACTLTMNNLFGTGRIATGTGIVLAASPAAKPAPLLSSAIAWNPDRAAFRAAVSGTGQNAAGLATASALIQALSGGAAPVPEPGRANVISCAGYVPGNPGSCSFNADPRGAGLASAGN
jgi:gamma-glutamyltranspeptidase/glutathione hydrolase